MPSTPGGFVYPSATDTPDVPADLQVLAESIEDGNAWVTSTAGFTAAANWTLNSVRYRRIGNIVDLFFAFTRTTSAITQNAAMNPTNVALLTAIPSSLIPGAVTSWHGSGSSAGRLCQGPINADGTVDLGAFAGTSDWGSTESGSGRAVYFLG